LDFNKATVSVSVVHGRKPSDPHIIKFRTELCTINNKYMVVAKRVFLYFISFIAESLCVPQVVINVC